MLRLFATDETNTDKYMGFSALQSYLGSIELKVKSNDNCTATTNNVQQYSYPAGMLKWLLHSALVWSLPAGAYGPVTETEIS
jgi:hypothetical protein